MIFSRLLHTEHEHSHDEYGEGGYTVLSTHQSKGINFIPLDVSSVQKFAALWWGTFDTRVIHLIEKAIITEQLSPVKLLHASKAMLVIVYDSNHTNEHYDDFKSSREYIAPYEIYDS
ncbi:hypothetical protein D3C75_614670 [compost metagenome]